MEEVREEFYTSAVGMQEEPPSLIAWERLRAHLDDDVGRSGGGEGAVFKRKDGSVGGQCRRKERTECGEQQRLAGHQRQGQG